MLSARNFFSLKNLVILSFIVLIVFSVNIQLLPDNFYLHDTQRLVSLILLALVLTHSAINRFSISNLLPISPHIRLAFFILLAFAIASTLLSHYPRHAAIELSIFTSLCYVALFTASMFIENKGKFIKLIIYVIWASILLYMIGFYVGYISAALSKTALQWPQPNRGFTSIRSFNQYQLWSIGLITLPVLAFNLKQTTKRWLILALTCWWLILFYSASRGVLLAWLVGMLITAYTYKKMAWPFLRLQLASMISGFLAYYVLFKLLPSLQQQDVVTSSLLRQTISDRTALWDVCFKIIEFHPFVGVGPLHYFWYTTIGTHPHNSVLQLGAEWGLPATFIMIGIAGCGFYSWFKKFNYSTISKQPKLDNNLTIILYFTIITNAAYSLVDGVIVMPISQILMFTIIGLMIGQYQHSETAETLKKSTKYKVTFRPVFAGIVLAALIWSTLPEVIQGLSGNPRGFTTGPNVVNTRIWVLPSRTW